MMSESGAGGCLKVNKNTRKGAGNVRWQHPEIPLTIMEENSLSSKHKESSLLTFFLMDRQNPALAPGFRLIN